MVTSASGIAARSSDCLCEQPSTVSLAKEGIAVPQYHIPNEATESDGKVYAHPIPMSRPQIGLR